MNRPKTSSTHYQNKLRVSEACPIVVCYDLISGRWKTHAIWALRDRPMRFSELRRNIPIATERMVARRLLELQSDGLIEVSLGLGQAREHKYYRLTTLGRLFVPLLERMFTLGQRIKRRPQWISPVSLQAG